MILHGISHEATINLGLQLTHGSTWGESSCKVTHVAATDLKSLLAFSQRHQFFPMPVSPGVVCSTAAGFQQSEQEEARGSLRCASTPWPHHVPCCHSAAGWTESGVTFWKFSYDACLVAATGGAETVCPLSQCLINSHLSCSENEGLEVGLTSLFPLVTY